MVRVSFHSSLPHPMLSDLRLAARSLRKSPSFVLVAVLTLALGIGATTTFFSLLHGVVLKPLPYREAEQLVELKNVGTKLGANGGRVSAAELLDYRKHQQSLVEIGTHAIGRETLGRADGAERIMLARVTANFFPLLGVSPTLGRNFEPDEEVAGRDRVVVISHAFWQRHFDGAHDVLGRTIQLNGLTHTVVGVMPADFVYEDSSVALWRPVDLSGAAAADRRNRGLPAIGRLRPGVSLAQASADLQRVAQQLRAESPAHYPAASDWSLSVIPLRQSFFGHLSAPLGAMLFATSAVLLIACANVAIMFLLRAAVRRREMMIRLSLGASRWHIVRQLLAESVVISALGGIVGSGLAAAGIHLLKAFPPVEIPRLAEVSLNVPAAAFVVGVLTLVTLLVGLAPSVPVLTARVASGLNASARSTESRAAARARDGLLVVEIALTALLLVGAGLSARSVFNLLNDELGYKADPLLTFKTNLTPQAYPDTASTHRFYEQLTTRIEALPGVAAVAGVSFLPLSGESQFMPVVPNSPVNGVAPDPTARAAAWRVVRGPYFSVMGARLLSGRDFAPSDRGNAPLVAIVDDEFARQYWSSPAAAVGQQVRCGLGTTAQVRTIVGVVRRLKHWGPGAFPGAEVYVPQSQTYQRWMYTVVKTHLPPATLTAQVKAELAAIDATVPMYFTDTMEHRLDSALAMPRFVASLVGVFSLGALALSAVGIFGVTAYSTAQRAREFGIRFAIGASRSHVARLVLGRVGRIALVGGLIGSFAAYQLTQLVRSQLYGVEPTDPLALVLMVAGITVAALLASLVPVAHALRVNPADALRAE